MANQCLVALSLFLSLCFVNTQATQEPMLGGVNFCHNTCTALVEALGENKAIYGTLPEGFGDAYFSARQREVVPLCVIQPSSPQDVSTVIRIINQNSCHFAVKSGGHAMFAGASNAIGGITIDLKYLNEIELSQDHEIAMIGPGNRWGEVYKILEPQGLTVVGGRASTVGVGGFMLGGGISFLSRFHGWASDNVRNYEVVLANGSISNINYESHPDLFWALRGGGNNFGIVTRFDAEVYRQGPVWGGSNFYIFSDIPGKRARSASFTMHQPSFFSKLYVTQTLGRMAARVICAIGRCTTTDQFFEVLVRMARKGENAEDVPYMHIYMSFAYLHWLDMLVGSSCMIHSEPVANPPAFKDFAALTAACDRRAIRNLTSIMADIDYYNPSGLRTMYADCTIKADQELLSKILDLFMETLEPIKGITCLFSGFVLQPITQIARANRHKNGGNPFGIVEEDGPLILLEIFPQWLNAEDDAAIQQAFTDFMNRSIALAKSLGLHHPWIYQNYANASQDVFRGYGEGNRQKLKEIQRRYDPQGVFTKLQPGYFKL